MLTLKQRKQENAECYRPGEFNEVTPVSAKRLIANIDFPEELFVKGITSDATPKEREFYELAKSLVYTDLFIYYITILDREKIFCQ